jgi:hypothetical protein
MKTPKLKKTSIILESDLAGIDEMVYNPITGNPRDEYDYGSNGGKIQTRITWPGHDDHLHIGTTNRDVMMKLIQKAQESGLSSTENPYAKNDPNGKVDSVHTKGSFHYKEFQGQPLVGAGVDFTGSKEALGEFIRWINANYKGKQSSPDATTEAPIATAETSTTGTKGSTTTTPQTTTSGDDYNVYGGLTTAITGGLGAKGFKKAGEDIWNKTMGKIQKAMAESVNSESNRLNEEINRIKKMMK